MAHRAPAGPDRHPFDGFIFVETTMTEKEIDAMARLCEEIDAYMAGKLKEAIGSHDRIVVVNAMMNIGTTMMSKVLLMVDQDTRQGVMQTAISMIHDKTKEGDAMIRSVLAMLQVQAMGSTCQPTPPTRH
jgi:hypothetical protein